MIGVWSERDYTQHRYSSKAISSPSTHHCEKTDMFQCIVLKTKHKPPQTTHFAKFTVKKMQGCTKKGCDYDFKKRKEKKKTQNKIDSEYCQGFHIKTKVFELSRLIAETACISSVTVEDTNPCGR